MVQNAFPRGELTDLTGARGRAREVRAEVIAALLLGAVPAEPGRVAALRLNGARITGTLSLDHAQITGPVRLRNCELDSPVGLSGARTRDLDLQGSRLTGLTAALAEISGNLNIIGSACVGQVTLTGARITGALQMDDCRIDYPGGVALHANRLVIDDDLFAPRVTMNGQLRLAGAHVGGVVLLDGAAIRVDDGGRAVYAVHLSALRLLARRGFTVIGETYLSGATFSTNLDFRGAVLKNPGGTALLAHGLRVGGFISFENNALVQGAVRVSRAKVEGEIYFSDGRFLNPGKDAIRCRGAEARTVVFGPGFTVEGAADFCHSRFLVIRDDPSCWPDQLMLSGLRYDTLDPPLPAAKRVEWLRRDTDGYVPQNYETLAAMYRRNGNDAAARTVLLARERRRREQLPWYGRAWSLLQEITVGYGYRPLRAGAWLAAFLVLGTVVFGLHRPPPLAGAPHPAFNPFIYTLDLLIPIVNFGLRNTYDPQGPERWLAYLLISAGWIFATTIAAGIARVLRRN